MPQIASATPTAKQRWILHCDCNSFFASVELLDHPEMQHLPVAVCGDPESRHGIILAKNEHAKRFGIQTAETLWQARKKCPELQTLPAHHEKYQHWCNVINEIYCSYTARVEPFSVDESWLDVTNVWHLYANSPKEMGDLVRERVKAETGLCISVGVSFNKIFAKMGSDYKKPDATTLITPQNYQRMLWGMPAREMIYVGKTTAQKLAGFGVYTIGDLAAAPPEQLTALLGKSGAELSRFARGEDQTEVCRWGEGEPIKSIGSGVTFKRNLITESDIKTGLSSLAQEVGFRLRKGGLYASAVQVTIKDTNLKSFTRQKQLPISSHLSGEIEAAAYELVCANWKIGVPIRMLTVTALGLTQEPFAVQQSFFDDAPKPNPKREALEQSLDKIRGKYGKRSIAKANIIQNELGLDALANETVE
ncbi:MAG: DNA polymerase IV [Faecalibacterium sp.]